MLHWLIARVISHYHFPRKKYVFTEIFPVGKCSAMAVDHTICILSYDASCINSVIRLTDIKTHFTLSNGKKRLMILPEFNFLILYEHFCKIYLYCQRCCAVCRRYKILTE